MNDVALRCGGVPTVTVKEHVDVRPTLSRVLHATVVVPSWNVDPLGGVHDVLTGGSPATTCGGSYTTAAVLPRDVDTVTGEGQTRIGPSVDGVTVGSPHPVVRIAPRQTKRSRQRN